MGESRPIVADPGETTVALTSTSAETRNMSVELYGGGTSKLATANPDVPNSILRMLACFDDDCRCLFFRQPKHKDPKCIFAHFSKT